MIGILGAYGDIGYNVLKALKKLGISKVKCGGRNICKVTDKMRVEFPEAIWETVDAVNTQQLAEFAENCNVILNCTGPSVVSSKKISENALKCGCKYIDVGCCDNFYEMSDDKAKTMVFASGSTPGLSFLLCRYLAGQFIEVNSIKYIFGALGIFSHGAAWDYIEGICGKNNSSLVSYRKGERTTMFAKRESQKDLPMFPRKVELCPFADNETDLIMQSIGAKEGTFCIALDGSYLISELSKIRMKYSEQPQEAIESLIKASRLEMTDKRGYIKFLIEVEGITEKGKETKTLYFTNESSSQLTAAVAACTATMAENGEIGIGIYPCGKIESYEKLIQKVLEVCPEAVMELFTGSIESLLNVQEGEI